MTLTAVEKESLRRTKWEADNTNSEVNKFIYKAVCEYIRARKLQEKRKRDQEKKQLREQEQRRKAYEENKELIGTQIKKLYLNQNKSLEEVAEITGLDMAFISHVIFQNGWNEEKKSNRAAYSSGSKMTGMYLAQSFGKGIH